MKPSLEKLQKVTCAQIENFVPDGYDCGPLVRQFISIAYERTTYCISRIRAWKAAPFDYLVSGQYATFLYFLGNTIWRETGSKDVPTRLFLLSKALNSAELFYELELPDVFFLSHTQGIVLAKAAYGRGLVLHQNCTVGRKGPDERPVIEEKVVLFPGAMVIGSCHLRPETVVGPGVVLVDCETPGKCYALQ